MVTIVEIVDIFSNSSRAIQRSGRMIFVAQGLLNYVRNQLFVGPFGNYTLNEVTNRITPFRVVRTSNNKKV